MKIAIEKITPGLAERMLAKNNGNRRIREGLVEKYTRDMADGHWYLTGDPIRFSSDGKLIDGQHRLMAVVKSRATIQSAVARGADDQIHSVIDTGATRTLANVLAWRGEKNTALLGAVVNHCLRYDAGQVRNPSWRASHEEALRYIDENLDIRYSVSVAKRTRENGVPMPGSVIGMVHFLAGRAHGIDEADAFFASLVQGTGLEAGSPVLVLRRFIDRAAVRREKPSSIVYAAVTLKAYNAWALGESIVNLYWRAGGADREGFPEIADLMNTETK